jgi:predicted small metal-binding protein
MKSFSCGAVVPGCTATFRGDTEGEILAQVAHHARHDHGLTEISDELVAAVRANVHTVR